jgi:hypothetical protein
MRTQRNPIPHTWRAARMRPIFSRIELIAKERLMAVNFVASQRGYETIG